MIRFQYPLFRYLLLCGGLIALTCLAPMAALADDDEDWRDRSRQDRYGDGYRTDHRADNRAASPLSLSGQASGWASWYLFGEVDGNTNESTVGIGILAFGDPYLVLRGAMFVTADNRFTWTGAEGLVGLALPYPISPYGGIGGLLASVDDGTDANGNSIFGAEAFYEWGAMARMKPVWAAWSRRNYYGDNGVPRGERTEMWSLGWSFDFE